MTPATGRSPVLPARLRVLARPLACPLVPAFALSFALLRGNVEPLLAQDGRPRRTADLAAEVIAAEQAMRAGDRADAMARARRIVAAYEGGTETTRATSAEHVLAGRAYVLLGNGDASAVRAALRAFDRGAAADPGNLEARRRAGALLLDKYNAPDARRTYEAVLAVAPADAEALLGLARVEEFEGRPTALATAHRSLDADSARPGALVLLARLSLEAEQFDLARRYAARAVRVDSTLVEGWALMGAAAYVTGDSASYRQALRSATALQPRPSTFFAELADAAGRQRRYAEAVQLAGKAVAQDSLDARALGLLGTNLLRTGEIPSGRAAIARAFALDPFNLWHKNTLDLLDAMEGFETIRQGRFELVAPREEAPLLALHLLPLLERAFDTLALRYRYAPPTPVRLEFFRQHADFSVRTLGLTGLGALGVSFGRVLALDAPSARERGSFNWGSTSWHELTHAFTLGASGHRVPRWISEGMSVLEERRAGVGWGARPTLGWLVAMNDGMVRPVSDLTNGFLHPRTPDETPYSYVQASMVVEWIEQTKGTPALPALLTAYREGLDTPAAFRAVLGLSLSEVDARFDSWLRQRYARDLASARGLSERDRTPNPFMTLMRAGIALVETQPDSAQRLLEAARVLMPEYAGDDGPAWHLARVALARADTARALAMLTEVTGRDETAWTANLLEAALREARSDRPGAMAALERLTWMWPYDGALHARRAALAAAGGDHPTAVQERRAVLATRPADLLGARFELARALAAAGEVVAARRELLQLLEDAPAFEQAQSLLLDLQRRGRP